MTGVAGSVWVGCQKAADLAGWTYTRTAQGATITGTLINLNRFYGAQRATGLRLMVGKSEWRWRGEAVDAEAGSGSYRVSGPPERR